MSARMIRGGAAVAALLLAWPAMAQQAPASDPHHPADAAAAPGAPATPAPSAAAPAAPRPGGGMGMMGMMGGGQGGMPMMMMGGGEGRPGMDMMRHHRGYGSPMNVIINVGPGIQVDVEDDDGRRGMGRRGMMRDGMPGMMRDGMPGVMGGGIPMREMPDGPGAGMGPGGPMAEQLHDLLAERFEGGLAFLRTELRIRPDQEAAWNAFATRIREAATKFRTARERIPVPAAGAGLDQRLAVQEARLSAELERARACREAASTLLPALDDGQRRTVEALSWLILPGGGPGPMARGMGGPAR
ncbi:Spy/CpxP family protein refolding chaperone [Neoroseomonas soli]|uniref:Spy/CpxP family protein refolding chaperone n=1 Tax=Neoroseomonas soli TaxID=1081025 RepID=A0A9X9WZ93_9PROT|nr:Spy/CpxP family protein refolding chaperone [Neoroseomonas soli]MBR0672472.1 Spy/CpxP family protein refolding chaperone [Neoroseomonas soli]